MTVKIIFFDLEGTLILNRDHRTNSSLWGCIPQVLGEDAIKNDEKLYAKWKAGGYRNYVAWCDESMSYFRKHGLTKKIFRKLLDEAVVREGVEETIHELHKRGIVTAIVSGGFQQQAARLQIELGIKHAFTAVQIYWKDDGTVAGWNSLPGDNEGKMEFVELMRKEFGFSIDECAFVGNGENDVHIAKHVGISFAVPDAHDALKKASTHTINDMRDVLKYF
jgi:phosphoserine phosphatase